MRDPVRIARILKKVEILWGTEPDTRLMQLLLNRLPVSTGTPYYVEDDVLENEIDKRLGIKNGEEERDVRRDDPAPEEGGSS